MANNNEPTHYMEDLNNVRTIMQDDDFVPTNARVITHRHQVEAPSPTPPETAEAQAQAQAQAQPPPALSSSPPTEMMQQQALLTKSKLQELVREVDPTEQLDEDVEEVLLQIADDFVENAINAACLFARHRNNGRVEVKDVQLYLERNWNMWIPGFGTDELRPYKRATVTEAHKQRLALIRKAIKKY